MKRIVFCTLCIAVAAGCAPSKNELTAKLMGEALDEMARVCEIKDESGVRSAALKIEMSANQLEKMADAVDSMSKSEQEQVQKAYMPKVSAVMEQVKAAAVKLAPHTGDPVVQKAVQRLRRVGERLQSMGN